jgi:tetratricopeptide (TPR) repeat protein
VYDWSRREELVYGVVFFLLVIGTRGMFHMIPLLMAMGLAGCGTFLIWKAVELAREPSVRVQNLQLKLKGRLKAMGVVFAGLGLATAVMGGWGASVKLANYASLGLGSELRALSPQEVLAPGYVPRPEIKTKTERALALLRFSAEPRAGGRGWYSDASTYADLAWLSSVAGRPSDAEAAYLAGLKRAAATPADASEQLLNGLASSMVGRGAKLEEVASAYQSVIDAAPRTARTRVVLAEGLLGMNQPQRAMKLIEEVIALSPSDPQIRLRAAGVLMALGRLDVAAGVLDRILAERDDLADAHLARAIVRLQVGQPDAALVDVQAAQRVAPDNPQIQVGAAQIYRALGRAADAQAAESKATKSRAGTKPPAR